MLPESVFSREVHGCLSLAMHIAIPPLPIPSVSLGNHFKKGLPCRHEGEHDQRIPKGVIVLKPRLRCRASFCETEYLDKHDAIE